GADVHAVTRRPIIWFSPDRTNDRSLRERIMAPNNGIAPSWENWILEHFPYLFYRLSQPNKDRYNSNYASGATSWVRERVVGNVALNEGCTASMRETADGKVDVAISDGQKIQVDHVLLATGYRANIAKLTMIHPSLRAAIRTDLGVPILTHHFE